MNDTIYQKFDNRYIRGQVLGVGASAVTYKGYDRLTKKFVAIKVIKINKRSPLELTMRELYVQKLLSAEPDCYDHVVCYYNSYLIPTNEPKLVILVNLLMVSLFCHIYNQKNFFQWTRYYLKPYCLTLQLALVFSR